MNHRKVQIEALLHRTISQILVKGLNDPRFRGLVSVTEVTMPPDMKHADVMISVIPEQHATGVMHALQHATSHIHTLVFRSVALRHVPHLHFKLDDRLKKQAAVDDAIREASEIEARRNADGDPDHTAEADPSSSPDEGVEEKPIEE